jgi:serine phosphatase RsbU (regulator of sigma subunit)
MARRKSLRSLIKVLWRTPLLAVPFAILFGTLFASGLSGYWLAYRIALVYALLISLATWALHFTPVTRWESGGAADTVRITLAYTAAAFAGSYLATVLVGVWFFPPLIASVRFLILVGMFTLIFSAVFIGVSYAISFHRDAVSKARVDEEMKLARRVQESCLVYDIPPRPGFDIHAVNVSSREVSGDFYDWVSEGDGTFLLAIADVSGKGFAAALLSSMLQASLRTQAGSVPRVSEIMRNLNRLVHRNGGSSQFATLFLGRLDEKNGSLSFTNAGHNQPVLFRKGGGRELLSDGGLIVGITESPQYDEGLVRLEPGDRLVLYTDGITEAQNAAGDFFDEERLYQLVESIPPEVSARVAAEKILGGVNAFLEGQEAGDDMTLIVVRAVER